MICTWNCTCGVAVATETSEPLACPNCGKTMQPHHVQNNTTGHVVTNEEREEFWRDLGRPDPDAHLGAVGGE